MDVSDWYAVALGSLVALSFTAKFLATTLTCQLLCYRKIQRYLGGVANRTWLGLLVLLTYLIGNVLGLTLYVDNGGDFIKRSGVVSVINLVPLALGGRTNLLADRCGISLETHARMHQWLARVVIVESLIHTIAGFVGHKIDLHSVPDVAAVIAATALLALLASGLVRHYAYETFLWLHMLFVVAALVSVYLHLPTKKLNESPAAYLLSAICLATFIVIVRLVHGLYRNARYKTPLSSASVRSVTFKRSRREEIVVPDAIHVHVQLSVPWRLRAGQYVYLSIPAVSRASFIQLHPFYVAWGYQDEHGNDYAVFIVQKRKGFTESLCAQARSNFDDGSAMKVVVDGPYGQELDLGLFGTVLLFATGVGIAAQLPYVAQLLTEYQDNETRRIVLCWQVESEIQTAWVADRMQMFLNQDVNRILDIRLFVAGGFLSAKTQRGHRIQIGARIDLTYDTLNAEELIVPEVRGRKGRTVISLCVDSKTSNEIHKVVRRRFDGAIQVLELDFRPSSSKGHGGLLGAVVPRLDDRAGNLKRHRM